MTCIKIGYHLGCTFFDGEVYKVHQVFNISEEKLETK